MKAKENVHELWRLLRYVRPYRARLTAGVLALAVVGLAEGLIALMITPLLDHILNPANSDSRLSLLKLPGSEAFHWRIKSKPS